MSEDIVTFHIRCEETLFKLKIKFPKYVSELVKKIKNELKLDESDDLVILCPVPDGKMMEIQSDDDIEFLKNTKLTYNPVNKELYCNVELVVIIIHKLPDNPKVKFKLLSNKLEQLASQLDKLSEVFNKKIYENESSVISAIFRSILTENSEIDLGHKSMRKSSGEPSKHNLSNLEPNNHEKKTKKDKEKFSSTFTSGTSNTLFENFGRLDISTTAPCLITEDTDILLKMLLAEGHTNTIQNIIVLKRFNNEYKKALSYLKSHGEHKVDGFVFT